MPAILKIVCDRCGHINELWMTTIGEVYVAAIDMGRRCLEMKNRGVSPSMVATMVCPGCSKTPVPDDSVRVGQPEDDVEVGDTAQARINADGSKPS